MEIFVSVVWHVTLAFVKAPNFLTRRIFPSKTHCERHHEPLLFFLDHLEPRKLITGTHQSSEVNWCLSVTSIQRLSGSTKLSEVTNLERAHTQKGSGILPLPDALLPSVLTTADAFLGRPWAPALGLCGSDGHVPACSVTLAVCPGWRPLLSASGSSSFIFSFREGSRETARLKSRPVNRRFPGCSYYATTVLNPPAFLLTEFDP